MFLKAMFIEHKNKMLECSPAAKVLTHHNEATLGKSLHVIPRHHIRGKGQPLGVRPGGVGKGRCEGGGEWTEEGPHRCSQSHPL